jgi:hypothetical protein
MPRLPGYVGQEVERIRGWIGEDGQAELHLEDDPSASECASNFGCAQTREIATSESGNEPASARRLMVIDGLNVRCRVHR